MGLPVKLRYPDRQSIGEPHEYPNYSSFFYVTKAQFLTSFYEDIQCQMSDAKSMTTVSVALFKNPR